MKNAGSILVFVIAFVVVTAIMIFLNTKFNNMWKFDFSAPGPNVVVKKDSTKINESKIPGVVKDEKTGMSTDSTKMDTAKTQHTEIASNEPLDKKVEKALQNAYHPEKKEVKKEEAPKQVEKKQEPKKDLKKDVKKENVVDPNKNLANINSKAPTTTTQTPNVPNSKESSYSNWLKSTSAIVDKMDAKVAARFIENFNESIARDIIYSLKPKKAADILAEIRPDIMKKIAQMKK